MDKPIGILGGTFDPVHNGHLRMAIEVMELCALDEVRLTPLHTPPHRLLPNTTPQHRLAMLSHAVKEVQGLRIDERELQRAGVSFTVDTLRSLREELGNKPLCLIMGMDAFQGLNTWHEWTSLVDLAHIIVASRPGVKTEIQSSEVAAHYKNNRTEELSDLHTNESGCIYKIDIVELDISSTHIRKLVSTKQNIQFLLPDDVISYIEEEDLYHRH